MGFDWVTARAACSLRGSYETLKREVQEDVGSRNKQLGTPTSYGFRYYEPPDSDRDEFLVILEGNNRKSQTVSFELSGDAIHIKDAGIHDTVMVTLDRDKQCRFLLNGSELVDSWQVRQRALDRLFFRA